MRIASRAGNRIPWASLINERRREARSISFFEAACPTDYKTKFPRDGQCEEDCAGLGGAKDGGYSVKEGMKGGATVQCRGLAVSRVLELPEAERTPAACAPVFGGDPCSE